MSIHWTNTSNGRAGCGNKLLEKAEAEQLADELNEEYPHIRHDAVEAAPPRGNPRASPVALSLNNNKPSNVGGKIRYEDQP